MAYTFLDNSLTTRGVLTNKGGQKNNYWGDTITHEIATSQDVLTSVSLSVDKPTVNIDTTGNQKTWNHVIQGLSFNIDGIGAKVNENDYLIYQEGYNGRQYLMAITQVEESAVDSGIHYKTVQGLNAAAYDLSRKTLKPMTFAQNPTNNQTKGTPANILKYVFKDLSWDVRVIGNFGSVDYEITDGATSQSVLLDIISMFEAEVDGYIEKDNWQAGSNTFTNGGAIKRIFEFTSSLGHYKGQTIRYNKNLVSITKTGARDSMYTKLYVQGNGIDISDVNKGADFLVDDVANRKYNKLGAMSNPVTYLEGTIANSSIDNPTALLAWGKKQLEILNHPRFNYSISATNDEEIQLGDTVIIQDTHASEPIFLKSKVISKNVSLADPFNNSFVVGEFSPIVIGADNGLEDTAQIMQLVNKANQTANDAIIKANENTQKIEDTRTDLEKTIDDKLQEGQDYADSLNDKAIEEQTKFNNQINQELATAKSERDALSAKSDQMIVSANSYADNMYNNAVAVAKTEASKALSDANIALGEAKTDLTTNLNKEIEDRNQAVSVVNSQAQDYATQAKSDAIEAAKTADGQVRKDFKVTTDALSSIISQNKEDSDGKISTAKTTATQALNGLSTKVSQTDYNKKTGDLSTAVNTVTQTATETKNELAKVSKTVGSESAKINTISNTVDGTTQTISDIQTEQGKQSGSIATLQSRADGFDATVTKVNNLSVGGRNLLLATSVARTGVGNNSTNGNFNAQGASWNLAGGKKVSDLYNQYGSSGYLTLSFDWVASGSTISGTFNPVWNNTPWGGLAIAGGINPSNTNTSGHYENTVSLRANGYSTGTATAIILRQDNLQGNITVTNMKLESGNVATDWSPAPEDVDSATAKAQLTADKATLDLSNYQKDANGRISKAQADITATSKEVSTKVSQSDFNTKTGDLTTKYGQVKATADAVTTDVSKYKTANDKKVSANSASINTLNNQITSKVSQTDFDKKTGDLSGKYSETKQTVDKISNTVTELQAKVNAQGQINQLINTEFSPDFQGWDLYGNTSGDNLPNGWVLDKTTSYKGSNVISTNTMDKNIGNQFRHIDSIPIPVQQGQKITLSYALNCLSFDTTDPNARGYWKQYFQFLDDSKKQVSQLAGKGANNTPTNGWIEQTSTTATVPDNASYVVIDMYTRFSSNVMLSKPMLVFDDHVGDYVPGQYNNNSRVSALEVSLDGIIGTVNDPKKGLSATAKLASDGMSVATTAKNDASTAIQTAKGVQTTVESMGQVNHLNNSEFDPDLEGWDTSSVGRAPYRSYFDQIVNKVTVGFNTMNDSMAMAMLTQTVTLASTPGARGYVSLSWQASTNSGTTGKQTVSLGFYDSSNKIIGTAKQADWSDTSGKWPVKKIEGLAIPDGAITLKVMFYASEKVSAYLAKPMLAFEKTIGTYTPSNYNNNATVTSIRTQLAGQITDEIENRTTGDKTVTTQLTDLIDRRVTSVKEGYESAISQSATDIMLSVSTPNRLINTQFTPDINGWNVANNGAGGFNNNFYRSYLRNGETVVGVDTTKITTKYYAYFEQDVALPGNNNGTVISLTWDANTNTMDHYANLWINFRRADGTDIDTALKRWDTPVGKGWQTQKWENISVPKDTDHIHVSFQTREGANAYLSRPMLTFTNTAMDYMPGPYNTLSTNSVLQLQSDNFSLNLHTNSQNIITSINGDNHGVTITGKQLTLDGNTTVTGDFYAKGGNFKNINASNITTGTINASKIKVINLDVKNLSGDVTNFIQSHWNGKFGSTTIDSSGITVSVPGSTSKFNSAGMETTFNKGSFVVRASTKDSGKSSGILLGMKDGATYTSFGFDSGSGYKDEMIITRTGSPAAKLYNIGGGVAFNHNVSLMDNVYMKPGKGFFSVWGNENRAIFFNTINAGIPAIVSPSGAGLAFGHGGQLYLLSHGIYQNIDDKKDRGGFKFDHPNVLG